jgi:hypothetical protein
MSGKNVTWQKEEIPLAWGVVGVLKAAGVIGRNQ